MKSRESLIRLKRFAADEKRRRVAQIEAMMADFSRSIAELDDQIEAEQKRAGISDPSHYAYPTFAKAAMVRRDNLKTSVAELETQLEAAREQLAEAFEELKKVELLEERAQGLAKAEANAMEARALDEIALQGARQVRF
jgi:flagellar FliJ protein